MTEPERGHLPVKQDDIEAPRPANVRQALGAAIQVFVEDNHTALTLLEGIERSLWQCALSAHSKDPGAARLAYEDAVGVFIQFSQQTLKRG